MAPPAITERLEVVCPCLAAASSNLPVRASLLILEIPLRFHSLASSVLCFLPAMSWIMHCRTATAALRVNRSFATSSAVAFPRARKRETRDVDEFNDADLDPGEPMDEMGIMLEELQSHQDEGTREGEDDTTSAGHLMIMRQREKLTFMRLIDHEMPQLVGMCVFLLSIAA